MRVPELARVLDISVKPGEAEVLQDARSVFVHGREPTYTVVSDKVMERYKRFETVLRFALLRASTDAIFCDKFATENTVVRVFGSLP